MTAKVSRNSPEARDLSILEGENVHEFRSGLRPGLLEPQLEMAEHKDLVLGAERLEFPRYCGCMEELLHN
jgi:hypothetical protein